MDGGISECGYDVAECQNHRITLVEMTHGEGGRCLSVIAAIKPPDDPQRAETYQGQKSMNAPKIA